MKKDYMDIKNSSDLARIAVLKAGINMIKKSPVYGIGYGMSRYRFNEFQDKSQIGLMEVSTIHNIYVCIFAEQGIIGLFFYLFFNFSLLFLLYKKIKKTNNFTTTQEELFCFISLSTFLIHGIIYHEFNGEGIYWITIAMCIIILRNPVNNKLNNPIPTH